MCTHLHKKFGFLNVMGISSKSYGGTGGEVAVGLGGGGGTPGLVLPTVCHNVFFLNT